MLATLAPGIVLDVRSIAGGIYEHLILPGERLQSLAMYRHFLGDLVFLELPLGQGSSRSTPTW